MSAEAIGSEPTFRRVLLPVDDSAAAARVATRGFELARRWGAAVVVVTVLEEELVCPDPDVFEDEEEEDEDEVPALLKAAGDRLNTLRTRALGMGLEVMTQLCVGVPAEEILKVAAEKSVDVIVMGSHSRSRLGALLMGSVSEDVARAAPCPVLIYSGVAIQALPPANLESTGARSLWS